MKKDFDKVCELQDVLFENSLELSADLISYSKSDDEKKKARNLHKEVVGSYAKVQNNNRQEAYKRGISIGMITGCVAALIGEIIEFVITTKKKK